MKQPVQAKQIARDVGTLTAETCVRYGQIRIWLRSLFRSSLHAATGALLIGGGTNGVEQMTPEILHSYVEGVGMDFRQAAAVFVVTLITEAVRFVHAATKPTGNTRAPFGK